MTDLYNKPEVGRLIVAHVSGGLGSSDRPTRFQGLVIASEPEDPERSFRMESGLAPHFQFPVRLIPLSDVLQLAYVDAVVGPERSSSSTPLPDYLHLARSTDKSTVYKVRRTRGAWTCECKGYEFRGNCRHISEGKLKAPSA